MYKVTEIIYKGRTIGETTKGIIEVVKKPRFERTSVFIEEDPELHLHFNCTSNQSTIEMYNCEFCGFKVYLKVILQVHIKTVHQNSISLDNYCMYSNENYNLSKILKFHKCDKCFFTSHSVLVLIKHQVNTHEEINVDDKTTKPEKIKPEKPKVTNKKSKVKLKEKRKYSCEECKYTCKCKNNLRSHIYLNHQLPEDKHVIRQCKQCPFKCLYESQLRVHERSHNDFVPIPCELCPYLAKDKWKLKSHFLQKHTPDEEIRWYNCAHCSYRAKQNYALRSHIKYRHTENMKWFLCEICSHRCKKLGQLKRHMLSHFDDRPLLCDICSAQFKTARCLRQHMSKKHKVEV